MTTLHERTFRLSDNPGSSGLYCGMDGLFYCGNPLLERVADGKFVPRSSAALSKSLNVAWLTEDGISSRIRSVKVVANALNKGDLARAMMAAVLMRLPDSGGNALEKAGYDPSELRDARGRWTFGEGLSEGELIPIQLGTATTFPAPWIGSATEEGPVEPFLMPRIDVVPPAAIPKSLTREPLSNPYPRKRKCAKEWADAQRFCRELLMSGKLGTEGYRGFGDTFEQCVRGQVSAECGGNPTAFELYS